MAHKGWFTGSPLTTGYALAKSGSWNPGLPGFNRLVVEWMDYSTPLRAEMYGPSRIPDARKGNAVEIRKKMYEMVTDAPFHCPSNPLVVPPYGSGSDGFPAIRATSFLTMWTIMRGGPGFYQEVPQVFPGVTPGHVAQSSSWEMAVPNSYMPRADKLGRECMKVFLADGLRYYAGPSDYDYTIDPSAAKGMMSAEPPSTFVPDNLDYCREYVMGREVSYRHGGQKNQINAAFFDGHVETLFATTNGPAGEPFRGTAVHPKYYYPSGTVVKDPGRLHLNIPAGTVLP